MFCPQCGAREDQPKQFCRGCGADLRMVRSALTKSEHPQPSPSARDEISRVLALKINELYSANDLKKVAEDVLPQIEKFLESPEEKRLRRLRNGVILAGIGMGAMIVGPLLSGMLHERELQMIGALGIVPFLIGLATLINGVLFSLPRKRATQFMADASVPMTVPLMSNKPAVATNELLPDNPPRPTSITEHTTHQLPNVLRQ